MNQRTRKLITMHKTLHLRDDVDRMYVSRKGVGRGLASIEESIDTMTRILNKKEQRKTEPETSQTIQRSIE